MKNLGILLSGRGSNFEAIAKNVANGRIPQARLAVVISNRTDARGLNIHPSLLPAFPGLEAQEQAFAYGVKVSGCTVHFVDEELDHGPIILQKAVAVFDSDDEHSLAARILEQEHIAYSEAINIVLGEKFEIEGRKLVSRTAKHR
jgi:folate-dependent phosphoribosylglycinamide formyltransferase PurN